MVQTPLPPINNADQTLHDKRATEQPRSVLIFKLKAEIKSGTIVTSRKRASFSSGDDKLYKNAREGESWHRRDSASRASPLLHVNYRKQ